MPFKIVRNDITKMQVDAIVNTANPEPLYGDGVDTAVYQAAGVKKLLTARKQIGSLAEGEVAITDGYDLPASYIIHAVSPCYLDGKSNEEDKLRSCYRKSLHLAKEHHCKSIAFPLISTGSYGYPKEEGLRIAVDEIHGFLLEQDMMIYLVVFDSVASGLGRKLYPDLEEYIDNHYVDSAHQMERADALRTSAYEEPTSGRPAMFAGSALPNRRNARRRPPSPGIFGRPKEEKTIERSEAADYDSMQLNIETELQKRMQHISDTFQQYLFYLMENKHLTNAEVYKAAIITKQTFSKIKNNENYHPDKSTAMRLCVGAHLNLDETRDLLARAGYALSPCDKRDIIFRYFIEQEIYDMIEIDIALEEHDLPCFIE